MNFFLETCVPELKFEKMTPSLEKTNKENSEQADSNDVASFKETNKLFLDSNNSSITDIIEPESKNINNNTAQLSEQRIINLIPSHGNETIVTQDSNASIKQNIYYRREQHR